MLHPRARYWELGNKGTTLFVVLGIIMRTAKTGGVNVPFRLGDCGPEKSYAKKAIRKRGYSESCERKSLSFFFSHSARRVWHSQTTRTRHPLFLNWRTFLLSRLRFSKNFCSQKSFRVLGVVVRRQPCRCQKHPCTKITLLRPGKTRSGEPGIPLT